MRAEPEEQIDGLVDALARAPVALRDIALQRLMDHVEANLHLAVDGHEAVVAYLRTPIPLEEPERECDLAVRALALAALHDLHAWARSSLTSDQLSMEGVHLGRDPVLRGLRFVHPRPFARASAIGSIRFEDCLFLARVIPERRVEHASIHPLADADVPEVTFAGCRWRGRLVIEGLATPAGPLRILRCDGDVLEVGAVELGSLRIRDGFYTSVRVTGARPRGGVVLRRVRVGEGLRVRDVSGSAVVLERCSAHEIELRDIAIGDAARVGDCVTSSLLFTRIGVDAILSVKDTRAVASRWRDVSAGALELDRFDVIGEGAGCAWAIERVSLGVPPFGTLFHVSELPEVPFDTPLGPAWPERGTEPPAD